MIYIYILYLSYIYNINIDIDRYLINWKTKSDGKKDENYTFFALKLFSLGIFRV